jgi:putative flippase GtrA
MISGRDKWRSEITKLAKFFFVGSSTFILQSGLYFMFTRWLFDGLSHTLVYVLTLLYVMAFNYSLNRVWTFKEQGSAKGSAKRYAVVALSASAICALMFWIGHDLLHIYDMLVVVVVNLLIPFYTFAAHRMYTFHNEPDRAIKRFVRSVPHSV